MSFLVSYNPKILKSQISCFAVLAWTPHFRILLQIFTRCIQVFIGPSHMGEHPTGFSQGPPSRAAFLQVSLKNLFLMFTYHFFFFITALQTSSKGYKISIGPDEHFHSLFFHFKQNFLFGDFSPLAGTPSKGTCSFNRP